MPETTVTDDGRRWWVVGAISWHGWMIYQAPNGRSAVAAYRRDILAAERLNRPVTEARLLVQHAGLHVVAGPLTTPAAYELDLARSLADEITRWSTEEIHVPIGAPIHPDDMAELIRRAGADKADRVRKVVRAQYATEVAA